MRQRYDYTTADDAIIKMEVANTPENVLSACCRAAAMIFREPGLATLVGKAANDNKKVNAVKQRWYKKLSVDNAEAVQRRGGNYLMLLHSRNHSGRNRKVQARGKELLIPITRTPSRLQGRASQELRAYLNGTE